MQKYFALQFFHTIGLSSKLYAVFTNGLSYQYMSGKVLDEKSSCHSNIFPLVAEKMAKFHLQLPMYIQYSAGKEKIILWDKIHSFLACPSKECSEMESVNKMYKKLITLRINLC